ncbi:hypothetical protein AAT19DRAFT_14865 [Rhodotorula toruloides]|uniref:Peptide hydrolase n=1 Tax=Rhodotorula toruloides TaxID=5286 RepID=A0A2T0A921_RHOTO|nr:hypothetical protein AAT19DRAFT_14865 [Rhodotorula toruloides]
MVVSLLPLPRNGENRATMHFSIPLVAATLATLSSALPLQENQQLAFGTSGSTRQELAAAFGSLPVKLAAKLEQHIASLPEQRLVKLGDDEESILITEGEKALLVLAGKRFIDVTEEDLTIAVAEKQSFPSKLSYNTKALQSLFDDLSTSEMRRFLQSFTGFRTRYYRSDTGKQSQQFLLGQIKQVAKSNKDLKIKVSEFQHSWGQNSIIARFEPSTSAHNVSDSVVIIGAHQDSTNLLPFLAAPGADDDASGTTSILSAFKSLVHAGFQPSQHPVEFHWYSAEEGGLLGSQAVAQEYASRGTKVRAMTQLDMTAYVKPGTEPRIGVIQDYVDPAFTKFLTTVAGEYAEIPTVETQCGYACSDHASWSKVGAPSAFMIESTFADSSKAIHSSQDTIDQPGYSLDHIKQFARVAIALAVELGGGDSVVA